MISYNRKNLENIKVIFTQKTGVVLEPKSRGRFDRRLIATAILVVFMFSITMTAYASGAFSSLDGDELSLSAVYEGNGIVSVFVENRSDKRLVFQPQVKLMLWSSGEEVEPVRENAVCFSGNEFQPHSIGVMTVDLSRAYDVGLLEQPINDDHYYFVLTNNNYVFGQDWMCSVIFTEPVISQVEEPEPLSPVQADENIQIISELEPYFDDYVADPYERNKKVGDYFEECRSLLSRTEGRILNPVSPPLVVDGMEPEVIFDESAPVETQHWLTGLNRRMLDGYNIPVGARAEDTALVISAFVPQHKGDIDGGAGVPLIYIFTYDVNDIQSPQDLAFIHGRLLTFEQMEQYKVYEDDRYVCYEVTDLFYSDLRLYVESMISQRTDVYYDEQVWERVENISNYYRDKNVLESRFYYNVPIE